MLKKTVAERTEDEPHNNSPANPSPFQTLKFISETKNLKQVPKRFPQDNLYPPIKSIDELEKSDIVLLVKKNDN